MFAGWWHGLGLVVAGSALNMVTSAPDPGLVLAVRFAFAPAVAFAALPVQSAIAVEVGVRVVRREWVAAFTGDLSGLVVADASRFAPGGHPCCLHARIALAVRCFCQCNR